MYSCFAHFCQKYANYLSNVVEKDVLLDPLYSSIKELATAADEVGMEAKVKLWFNCL